MASDEVHCRSVVVPVIDMKSIDVVDDLLSSLLPSSIFVKIVSWGVLLIQVKSWSSLMTLPLIVSLMSDRGIESPFGPSFVNSSACSFARAHYDLRFITVPLC